MALKTTVVIVNWNGAEFLESLLRSVAKENPRETIVIDNASTDGSMEILSKFSGLRILSNSENLGFGKAANQGIEQALTPYVLILNADMQALSGSIDALEQFMEENPKTAIVAPQLLFPDKRIQPSCRSFPTIRGLFLYLSYLDRVVPSGYRLKGKDHSQLAEVDQPMGAALMFRKSVLDTVGMFDPRYFLYMEEVDLCERIKRRGWKIFYLPKAQIIHHAGGSTRQDWERSQRNFFESVVRYFRARSSTPKMIMLKCSLAVALVLRSIILLPCGRWRQSKFYFGMSFRILRFGVAAGTEVRPTE